MARRWMLLTLLPIASCGIIEEPQRGAEGLFEVLFAGPNEERAAEWAIDRYDADHRYRGTLLLVASRGDIPPSYIELFERNLDDEDPSVRAAAIRGLANHGEVVHVESILPFLDHREEEDEYVRAEAARALQRLHDPLAIDPLLSALQAPDPVQPDAPGEPIPAVRAEIADALGQYAENRVVRGLVASLQDRDLAVNRATRKSLRTLTGQDLGYDQVAWQRWLDESEDPFAARAVYLYPIFARGPRWFEFIPLPFLSEIPNEVASTPVGFPPVSF